MADRTVTLSDGSVWRLDDARAAAGERPWTRIDPCSWGGWPLMREPHLELMTLLTAADHRAIADVLDGQSARDAIVEECAKVCDTLAQMYAQYPTERDEADAARCCATTIRSLKSTPTGDSK